MPTGICASCAGDGSWFGRRSLPLAVQLIHPPVTDRWVSDGGGLSEENFLAQPRLQQFDFD